MAPRPRSDVVTPDYFAQQTYPWNWPVGRQPVRHIQKDRFFPRLHQYPFPPLCDGCCLDPNSAPTSVENWGLAWLVLPKGSSWTIAEHADGIYDSYQPLLISYLFVIMS